MRAITVTLLYSLAIILFTYVFTYIYARGFIDSWTYAVALAFMLLSVFAVYLFVSELEENPEFRRRIIHMLSRLKIRRKP